MAKPHFNFSPEELQSEEWRPIPSYEGYYSVSSLGRIRRDKQASNTPPNKILSQCVNKEGYCGLSLSRGGAVKQFFVHSLVMRAFVGERPDGFVTNHKDGDGANNRFSNLEYVTYSENTLHGLDVLGARQRMFQSPEFKEKHRASVPRGTDHYRTKITPQDIQAMRRLYDAGGVTALSIAKQWGISHKHACRIVNREVWTDIP